MPGYLQESLKSSVGILMAQTSERALNLSKLRGSLAMNVLYSVYYFYSICPLILPLRLMVINLSRM